MTNFLYHYLRSQFKQPKSGWMQLIWLHILSFVLIGLLHTFFYICGYASRMPLLYEQLTLPSCFVLLLKRPWAIVTYSFVHHSFLELGLDMLMLYTFGQSIRLVTHTKSVVYLYCLGKIAGACAFFALYQLSPPFKESLAYLHGPLPAIYAIMVAVCVLIPDLKVNLFFISLPLRVVVVFLLLFSFMQLTGKHAGHYVAQLGGAIVGYLYAQRYKNKKGGNQTFGGTTKFIRLHKTT
ncbi:rhomboid family intramembrane serine protease [Candidatus Cardinium hertigii]|uniref:Peptidase S54 rhomboid domain-containing protein n=1 Tax=Candidatus Cardinium hertigii TaxID=247481 RepID=A0A2Z3L7M6_9BACT|nr:rhomboid family intramembrane serine protease [Candidatus Cardinium hertigii]AWN81643.1 hypothetical protein DK880_00314 [Candidatus Cardinium hertigii]